MQPMLDVMWQENIYMALYQFTNTSHNMADGAFMNARQLQRFFKELKGMNMANLVYATPTWKIDAISPMHTHSLIFIYTSQTGKRCGS